MMYICGYFFFIINAGTVYGLPLFVPASLRFICSRVCWYVALGIDLYLFIFCCS